MLDNILNKIESGERYIVKISAPWCMPCRAMDRVIDQIVSENEHLEDRFIDVDIEEHPNVGEHFGVYSIPCFVYIGEGKYGTEVGTQSAVSLTEWFD
jgi:thioredoxin 1